MILDPEVVGLSRLQFALTALYHFLFVPLTLGLVWILAIMESVYVMTGREVWKRMVQFWGVLFGINFAMGVATGITMEFQFGMNWAYYSHYVGDVFGTPLAIEGLMAFFLEGTLIGVFFMGWTRTTRLQHLVVTWLLALATSLSALWILVANGWMQYPVGAKFNVDSMRMEVTSFADVLFNPVAQAKFVHTVSAGYVLGSMFVLSISAWYLLRGRNVDFAKRSMTVAASFGLASALSVVVLGDESGYAISENQKMKMAAIEAMWETEPPPASFTLFGIPDVATRSTHFAVRIPWVMGLIGTRSLDKPIPGIANLVEDTKGKIDSGLKAYDAMLVLREDKHNAQAKAILAAHDQDMGYALLLKRFMDDPRKATPADIQKAADSTIPNVPVLFWAFRFMVLLGFYFIALFAYSFWRASKRRLDEKRWYLKLALWSLPLPWVAAELGWIVAEYGRQPWAIEGILPTALGVSSLTSTQVWISLAGFVLFYTALAVIDVLLMVRYARKGPDGLGLWPQVPRDPSLRPALED
ncbi:cytochrome ubiquinol oxidase subunit I [Aerosticca soli]|uniref:Cytochrome d ubiquinol oxidase subunit I n=1 Tax=Aerosticca soli TaxID=2010829 RepID=A0A2Z6E7A0_9GAMM|nr:cytochrome ubiquinol oxidase subunit I [Aerosticca soli]MDI3262219.1 cytochrome ubiquinol oxidase subunit I [Fulvimonas sp.]BBD80897.1 cytochrome d ubiquinol oxidase subunit I [Aerosticca soli]